MSDDKRIEEMMQKLRSSRGFIEKMKKKHGNLSDDELQQVEDVMISKAPHLKKFLKEQK